MATDIFKIFTKLGLSDSESKVYLASLSLGPTSVQDIAKKARLSRTATYDTVKTLKARGLLSTSERGKKTFFAAEEPDRVVNYFKDHVESMKDELQTLKRVMPEIKMMAGGERPSVRFYEGDEAMYSLFADVAKVKPKVLRELANIDDIYAFLERSDVVDAQKSSQKVPLIKVMYSGEFKTEPRPNVSYGKLPKDTLEFHGDIWIYSNRVAFVSFIGKMVTVIVENQAFADTSVALFDTAWKVCKIRK
ncbi:MAG TPA: helix-turn-helix domain-containing protein [Patescibacteria group bacterium]|nr:helix-turn-helix domain-containing protein [Patescibacteria group bacterium]